MAKEFKLQDPGEGIREVEIQEVLVAVGDRVEEGQSVLVVESDKAAIEVPSPYSGVVEAINFEVGDRATVGDVLMTVKEEVEGSTSQEDEEAETQERRPPAESDTGEDSGEEEAAPGSEEADEAEEAAEAEETEAGARHRPAAGKARSSNAAAPDRPAEEGETDEDQEPAGRDTGPVPATPATPRLARELEVDLRSLEGSGPDGRVLDRDVRAAADRGRSPGKTGRRPAAGLPPLPDFSRWGEVERQPLRSIRRTTAQRMAAAWSQIPHVTHQEVADVTALESFRAEQAPAVEEQGGSLTPTVFAIKAAVAALKEQPRFNASYDAEAEEIVVKRYFHIGVAVDTEQGLLVPVIRDADRKSVTELAAELKALVSRAREGKLDREAMSGGSFTVTNIGAIGGTAFTPLINYPQVAILGLARARLEPIVEGTLEDFEIVPRLRLPLSLAFDHRVVDGAEAARFARKIADTLADVEAFALAS